MIRRGRRLSTRRRTVTPIKYVWEYASTTCCAKGSCIISGTTRLTYLSRRTMDPSSQSATAGGSLFITAKALARDRASNSQSKRALYEPRRRVGRYLMQRLIQVFLRVVPHSLQNNREPLASDGGKMGRRSDGG
jgi:hypothetical protein